MGLVAGTPAVIIPIISERESNARRVMALGASEIDLPTDDADGEKRIDVADFGAKVQRVLTRPSYRQSAQRISKSMRELDGIREATDQIERLTAGNRRPSTTTPS